MDHMNMNGAGGMENSGDMKTMVVCTTAAPGMGMNMNGHSDMGSAGSSCDTSTGSSSGHGGHSTHATISDAELYIEVIMLVVTIVIGLVVNTVAIVVIIITKSMRTGTFLMLGNLCLNGLLLAGICMPVHVASVIQNKWTLGIPMCNVEAYLIAICAIVSILTHTEVAIVRYCAAVAPQHVYKKLSSWQATTIWLTGAWVLGGALIGVGVYIGIVIGEYSALYSRCTPINMKRLLDVVIAGTALILTCYAIITFSYVRLFIVIRNKVQSLGQKNSKQNVRFMKVTKTLLVLSVVFIVCWLPFIITCGVDPDHDILPIFVHRLSHNIAEILSCINPIFYFLRIDEFKVAIKRMLHIKGHDESSTDGASTDNRSTVTKKAVTKTAHACTEESRY